LSVAAFDPREDIRTAIGYAKYIRGEEFSTVSVADSRGDAVFLPLLMPHEAHSEKPAELPYIEMRLVSVPASTMNIGGDVHYSEAYLDFKISYIVRDYIDGSAFGSRVCSEIVDKIMENRATTNDVLFCEVIDDGREMFEGVAGNPLVFHRILQLKCNRIQKKS